MRKGPRAAGDFRTPRPCGVTRAWPWRWTMPTPFIRCGLTPHSATITVGPQGGGEVVMVSLLCRCQATISTWAGISLRQAALRPMMLPNGMGATGPPSGRAYTLRFALSNKS